MIRPPPRSPLFPSPPLSRSIVTKVGARRGTDGSWRPSHDPADLVAQVQENLAHLGVDALDAVNLRSEEHTSELQSRLHLVCRLLLEKKKKSKSRKLRA